MSQEIDSQMDLDKTEKIFYSLIARSHINDTSKEMTPEEIKKINAVLQGGNLHVNTAKVKISATRLAGFRDGIRQTKLTVQRKTRNARKYGGR